MISLDLPSSNRCSINELTKVPIHEKIEWVLFILLGLVEDCIHDIIAEQNSEQAMEKLINTYRGKRN